MKTDKVIYLNTGRMLPFYVGVAFTEKAFKKETKRLGVTTDPWLGGSDFARIHTFEKGSDLNFLICMSEKMAKTRTLSGVMALAVHEVMHLWQALKDHIGETHPGSELEAYIIQHIVGCLFYEILQLRGIPDSIDEIPSVETPPVLSSITLG
jgi:hypothetical protein